MNEPQDNGTLSSDLVGPRKGISQQVESDPRPSKAGQKSETKPNLGSWLLDLNKLKELGIKNSIMDAVSKANFKTANGLAKI